MPVIQINPSRWVFKEPFSKDDAGEILTAAQGAVLQTCQRSRDNSLAVINDLVLTARPDLRLRFYGFYGDECDFEMLRHIPNVRNLEVDCLLSAKNIRRLCDLDHLESLSFGVFEMDSLSFFDDIQADHLTELWLWETRSKVLSLAHLSRFKGLKTLGIEGHRKSIETLSELTNLEELMLRSVSRTSMAILVPLTKLWSLDIKLGGSLDLEPLSEMHRIKFLQMWQIRGLENIDFVSYMRGLQFIILQSLTRVKAIPDLSKLPDLRRLLIDNLKSLHDIVNLGSASNLQDLFFFPHPGITPDDLLPVVRLNKMVNYGIRFRNAKKNAQLETMFRQHLPCPVTMPDFEFR